MSSSFLRSPDFGNSFRFTPNTIQHRTIGGNLRTFQGNRPTWEGFSVSFSALTKAQIDRFRTYILVNRGEIITLTDHENRVWIGIISSKEFEIINNKDTCTYQASFEFEGSIES